MLLCMRETMRASLTWAASLGTFPALKLPTLETWADDALRAFFTSASRVEVMPIIAASRSAIIVGVDGGASETMVESATVAAALMAGEPMLLSDDAVNVAGVEG